MFNRGLFNGNGNNSSIPEGTIKRIFNQLFDGNIDSIIETVENKIKPYLEGLDKESIIELIKANIKEGLSIEDLIPLFKNYVTIEDITKCFEEVSEKVSKEFDEIEELISSKINKKDAIRIARAVFNKYNKKVLLEDLIVDFFKRLFKIGGTK